ncbi:MAG: hypothetical protein RLZZ238_595 [Planctomycetota bacterium]|jgi:predicted metal-dependent peptidase
MKVAPDTSAVTREDGESTTCSETEAVARGRLEKARIDILLDHPFLANALLRMPLRGTWDEAIPNPVLTDGRRIVYRFDLVASMLRPAVRVLVLHALLHSVLGHADRIGGRNRLLWTIACDAAVNELLDSMGEGDPAKRRGSGAMRDAHLDCDPQEGLSVEEIYDQLSGQDSEDGLGENSTVESMPPPEASDGLLPSAESRDIHDEEREERAAFMRTVGDAEVAAPIEFEEIRKSFLADMKRRNEAAGSRPGDSSSELDAAEHSSIDWQAELANFLRSPIDRTWSFTRPNRKHLWRGIYLPGIVQVEGGRFVVAIDTSGSMSYALLGQVLGEIDALRRSMAAELTIVQFDSAIRSVEVYPPFDAYSRSMETTASMHFRGRGGTNLHLPFRWTKKAIAAGQEVSALIVCTDGYGPLPVKAPAGLPVLFLLTREHRQPGFGQQIVLPPLSR